MKVLVTEDFLIEESALNELKKALEKAGNTEIFAIGHTDNNNEITEINVVSWGNEFMAPAIINNLKQGDVVIHNHPSGNLTPSPPDINLASYLGNQGIGFYIINNDVSEVRFVTKSWKGEERNPIDTDKIKSILGPDGPIAKNLQGYEYRESQVEMAIEVADAFNNSKISIIEAGTGTGKTMAYLIPSIMWAINNKEKILISTNTINLQEQLLKKDIPLLKEVLDIQFNAVLVKGRNNYLCLRKAKAEESDLTIGVDENLDELMTLIQWSKITDDGSLSDLNFIPREEIWDRLKCESDTCLRVKCSFYKNCFLLKARRKASQADLLIVNHHLLFADLSLRANLNNFADLAILPPYSHIIIDEAHHIEDVSTKYFGLKTSKKGLIRILNRLWFQLRKKEAKGVLLLVSKKLNKIKDETVIPVQKTIDSLITQKNELVNLTAELFDEIAKFTDNIIKNEQNELKLRITDKIEESIDWENTVRLKSKEFINSAGIFITNLSRFHKKLDSINNKNSKIFDSNLIEIAAISKRVEEYVNSIENFMFENNTNEVKWIELKKYKKGNSVSLNTAPLKIDTILKEYLFNQFDTIIMTSATLTVNNNFDYFKDRTGISTVEKREIIARLFPSPFDFKSQVIIGIPLDIPPPTQDLFPFHIEPIITEILKISKGKAFILFTSYMLLNLLYSQIITKPELSGITMLKQGDENRHNLLKKFKKDINSVLFGTDSFWEGVDVSGEALEAVIIVRLPFRVPTEPIYEARREEIEKSGRDSFIEYTVPQAVIKFKQGFGRLIRNNTDRGSIIILDKRIQEKYYGNIFLNSLPECRTIIGTKDAVLDELRKFYYK